MSLRYFIPAFTGLVLAFCNPLSASTWNKSFVMNTPEPILAGDKLLTPGVYVWKLMDSNANRHIVEITDQKSGHVETTILALPKYRALPATTNEFQFWETPVGAPRAVRSWFYPGDTFGQEFAYPKNISSYVASVHLAPSPLESAPQSPQVSAPVSPTGHIAVVAPAVPSTASRKPVKQGDSWAVISDPVPSKVDPAASTTEKHSTGLWNAIKKLPLTATLAPLIGLIGVASLILFSVSYLKRTR